ncbi:hypothetical protein CMI37_10825 [Candidatus Pacearchaeota archaeon]|nr:hypothetical protein [Candidatus Pacearchaeota archaeon]|tara:strand:- start:339 stop:1625 length:1287 start_codon:yes stop_codon:yes gene_type:complete
MVRKMWGRFVGRFSHPPILDRDEQINQNSFFQLIELAMILLIGIMLVANVSALGITPARTTIDFEPGFQREVGFSVLNSEGKDMSIVVYVQGELNASIGVSENTFQMSASEESRQLSYNVNLPAKLSPGLHIGEVVVMQLPGKSGTSEAFIGAALAVVTQLYVQVPYPGKYAEATLNIINANQGDEVVFVIPVLSRGEFDLVSVKANVDIYNKMGEKVDSFNTNEISVDSGARREIVYKWEADVPVGAYRALATLIYDGEVVQLEGGFNVGSEVLDLQGIDVRDFSLGDIAKLEMLVENKWSEPIRGAYTQTEVYNKDGEVSADFKSPEYIIPALSKEVMISYWDTSGVKAGTYDTRVYLKYGDVSIPNDLKLKVEQNKIGIIGLGYVISADSEGGGNTLVVVLVIGIVTLVLINLLWFFFLRKRLRR